ncbi:hypothetical protein BDV11DRAFT_176238 [Aspergillus similis]
MSQLSNIYPSSSYDVVLTDTFSTSGLHSDGPLLTTAKVPFIEEPAFNANTDLCQPIIIPFSLTRVGPGRRKDYILNNSISKDDFITWWLQTTHGKDLGGQKFKWD